MIFIISNHKDKNGCSIYLHRITTLHIFQITGPNITQAILERKATRKKRKTEIEKLNGPKSGCDANNRFNSI